MTDASNNIIICDLLKRRSKFFSLLSPGPRYNPVSPYPNYTQAQLDMRRKAEILQYKKNSTQTTQLTKSQRFASVVNGSYQVNSNKVCNKDLLQPTPTSASGIPGPLMILRYDPTVPLYNYQTKQNTSAFVDVQPPDWQVSVASNSNSISTTFIPPQTNATINSTIPTNIFAVPESSFLSLCIQNNNNYNFNLRVPVGIYVSGNNVSGNNITSPATVNFTLKDVILNVYYYPGSSIYTLNGNSLVSSSIQISNFTGSFTVGSGLSFYGSQYFSNIFVPSIPLSTQYGDVYDFKFSYNIQIAIGGTAKINDFYAGIYTNIPKITPAVNCVFIPQPSSVVYQNYSLGATVN
jgi:hypothetical protein